MRGFYQSAFRNGLPRFFLLAGGLATVGILAAGCRFPWVPEEEPGDRGRLIQDAVSLYEMGRNLEKHGNYDGALRRYRESIALSPRPIAYLALGSLLTDLHQFEEAVDSLETADRLAPGNPRIQSELDRARAMADLVRRGQPVPESVVERPAPQPMPPEEKETGSEEEPEPGLPVPPPPLPPDRPDVPEPPPEESVTEKVSPEPVEEQQIPQVQEPAVETKSQAEEVRLRSLIATARELIAEDRLDEAASYLQRALIEFPREGKLYYNLGYVYQLGGRSQTALEAYQKAVELGYKGADVYNNLGILYQDMGNSDQAVESFKSAVLLGGFPEAAFHLGEILELRGELAKALDAYETYLREAPEGPLAEDARNRAERLRRRR